MDEIGNVTDQLKVLLEQYDFNAQTRSAYLGLSAEQFRQMAVGDLSFLPEDAASRFRVFNKISFLYMSAVEDKDLKLSAFLGVLISYHGLSKKTIAKMSGVEVSDIEKILSDPPGNVLAEQRYKVAVTVMALRFFLKDNEPRP